MRYDGDTYQTIPLSQIRMTDDVFRITTAEDIKEIAATLEFVGLIRPPIVRPTGDASGYIIIAGFQRIAAAIALGWKNIEARILAFETDDFKCALLAVADNSFERPLNLIELSNALRLLAKFIPEGKDLRQIADALKLPSNPNFFQKLLKIGKLHRSIQEGILQEVVSLPSALLLEKMDQNTAITLSDLLKELKVSLNKQRELIVIIDEIAKREDTTIAAIIGAAPIRTIRQNPDLDRNQKYQQLRQYLNNRRYPNLSAANSQFADVIASLSLPSTIRIVPPPGFEGKYFSLSLSFSDLSDLISQYDAIHDKIQHPKLTQFFHSRNLSFDLEK